MRNLFVRLWMLSVAACGGAEAPAAAAVGSVNASGGAPASTAGMSGSAAAMPVAQSARPAAGSGARAPATTTANSAPPTAAAGARAAAAGASGAGTLSMAAGTGSAGTPGAAAGSGAGGAGGVSGAAGAAAAPCEKGTVKASDVVFIGESFIAQTGAIPRLTSELAREAGTIGDSESYRSFAVSGTQLTTGDIPNQYMRAKAAAPVKVVLMDGGGNDLLIGNRCQGGFDAACKEVVSVVEEMFSQFQSDGAKDVVYFFYPDPMGIGAQIKDAMDILRPEMKKLCDETAAVRCVWVDQRESWDGNYDEFTSDGIHPTEAGSAASAKQIWDAMVEHCVAQ